MESSNKESLPGKAGSLPKLITERFGERVSRLVAEVTDDKSLPKERRKQLPIETAPHKSNGAKQIKLADKICNVGDIDANSPELWETQQKVEYLDWAERVISGCRGVNESLDNLFDQTVAAARQRIADE